MLNWVLCFSALQPAVLLLIAVTVPEALFLYFTVSSWFSGSAADGNTAAPELISSPLYFSSSPSHLSLLQPLHLPPYPPVPLSLLCFLCYLLPSALWISIQVSIHILHTRLAYFSVFGHHTELTVSPHAVGNRN